MNNDYKIISDYPDIVIENKYGLIILIANYTIIPPL